MNRLSVKKRAKILGMMVEGMSIRAITRIEDVSKNTILKLLKDVGEACAEYQDTWMHELPCRYLEVDEIWSFVYARNKNLPAHRKDDAGEIWTWTAICADTKLVPTWLVGDRDLEHAKYFIKDLAGRMAFRVQITSDGLNAYVQAVENAFGEEVDYARIVKIDMPEAPKADVQIGPKRYVITGSPNFDRISTSYVERQNLTMRMSMRRFTRHTNAFSKKIENHYLALAIYFMHYNYSRIHQTLRMSPAMAAEISDRLWSLEDIVKMAELRESSPKLFWRYTP